VTLLCCGAEFVDDGQRHRCVNPPKRYVIGRVELKREPSWECRCRDPFTERRLLRKHRHTWEPECIPQADVDAFIARTGCGKRTARYMLWLERNFSPLHESEIPF
jgi:hypothetical protein